MNPPDDVVQWLCEDDNPPVAYLTLRHLLGKSERTAVVRETRGRLMDYAGTRGILRHSRKFLADDAGAYQKYKGKYWQMIFLGLFLADGDDPRIAPRASKASSRLASGYRRAAGKA